MLNWLALFEDVVVFVRGYRVFRLVHLVAGLLPEALRSPYLAAAHMSESYNIRIRSLSAFVTDCDSFVVDVCYLLVLEQSSSADLEVFVLARLTIDDLLFRLDFRRALMVGSSVFFSAVLTFLCKFFDFSCKACFHQVFSAYSAGRRFFLLLWHIHDR